MSHRVKVLEPSGILDATQAENFDQQIINVIEEGADIVLIDLQDVKFMDSSGLRLIVSAYKTVKAANLKFFLCSLNHQAKMICELSGINKLLDIFPDRQSFSQAINSVEQLAQE